MKGIVLIISLLLSCVFSGTGQRHEIFEERLHETVAASTGGDTTEKTDDFNDVAILPVRAASFAGEGGGFAQSLRVTNSGRRVQPSFKSASRIIKAGKVFDRSNFYAFLTVILQFQSGIRSNSRYIYSICQLLI